MDKHQGQDRAVQQRRGCDESSLWAKIVPVLYFKSEYYLLTM
jgi:hypothetical protein